jgi:Protein of unknown function (DUF962).
MVGVPLIVASLGALPFSRSKAAMLFLGGWTLQLLGHYAFEHNKPVFLEVRTPKTAWSALVFVTHQWKRFLSGKGVVDV